MGKAPGVRLAAAADIREEARAAFARDYGCPAFESAEALCDCRDVFPNGEWGKANLEICLAILASAREGRDIELRHQVLPSLPVSRQ
jgi:hypothetical protein